MGGESWACGDLPAPPAASARRALALPDGWLSERCLLDALCRQGQEALSRDALVGRDAEEAAGGDAGVFGEHLEVRSSGEAFAQFPQIDGVGGEAEVGGNLLEGKVVLLPPGLERHREGGVDVALQFRLSGHTESLGDMRGDGKRGGTTDGRG